MCHSREHWTFWSHRQQHRTPEAMNRSDEMLRPAPAKTGGPSGEPVMASRKDEPVQREKELEPVS
jgi:hypothetical protein